MKLEEVRLEGLDPCHRCGADYWEVVWAKRGRYMASCMFCLQTRPMFGNVDYDDGSEPISDGFRLQSGRFEGMTIAEMIQHPMGNQYAKWVIEGSGVDESVKGPFMQAIASEGWVLEESGLVKK